MPLLPNPPLQPLRIPSGWQIAYNQFFDVEPDSATEACSESWWHFNEDMLQLTNVQRGLLLDLGWYPEHQPDECFRLVLIQFTSNEDDMIAAWNHPFAAYESSSRHDVVMTIEAWLHNLPSKTK